MAKKTTPPAATAAPVEPKHLCDDCASKFPECAASNVTWGIDTDPTATGANADRVVTCDKYQPGCVIAAPVPAALAEQAIHLECHMGD